MFAKGFPFFKSQNSSFQRVQTGETVQPSFFKSPNAYGCSDTECQLTFNAVRLRHLFLLNASLFPVSQSNRGNYLGHPTSPLYKSSTHCSGWCPEGIPAFPAAGQHSHRPLGEHTCCSSPCMKTMKIKTLTWVLIRHLTGIDDGERQERTGDTDDDETAEYQFLHRCCPMFRCA